LFRPSKCPAYVELAAEWEERGRWDEESESERRKRDPLGLEGRPVKLRVGGQAVEPDLLSSMFED